MWVGDRLRVRVATTPLTFDHPGQWLLAAWARRDRHGRRVASTPLALHGSHHRFRLPVLIVQLSHTTSIYCTVPAHGGDGVHPLQYDTYLLTFDIITYHTRYRVYYIINKSVRAGVFARCIIYFRFSYLQGVRHRADPSFFTEISCDRSTPHTVRNCVYILIPPPICAGRGDSGPLPPAPPTWTCDLAAPAPAVRRAS